MLSALLTHLPNVDNYLKRIDVARKPECTMDFLNELVYRHQVSVAFENIDIFVNHLEPSLGIEELYKKVVEEHKGGVCFELNSLFYALLKEIGFEAYPCLCKVLLGVPSEHVPSMHRATIVKLNGKEYYCDVGFGGPEPAGAMELVEDSLQEFHGETYRFSKRNGAWQLEWNTHANEFLPMMHISSYPVNPIDFLPFMHFTCCREQHLIDRFSASLLFNIRLENGNASLTNRVYSKNVCGENSERILTGTEDEIAELVETFKLPEEYIRLAFKTNAL